MNKKKILLSSLIILVVLAVSLGATFAWFTAQSDPIENTFTAGTVIIKAGEQITSGAEKMDNWNPGDCARKEFTIENKGTKSIALRGIIVTQWYRWDGVEDDKVPYNPEDPDPRWVKWTPIHPSPPFPDGYDAAELTFVPALLTLPTDDAGWYEDEGEPGTYYYNGSILGMTDPENPPSVKLVVDVCLNGPNADNQYQGKVFILSATFQAIQASHSDQWNWSEFDTYN